MTLDDPDLVRVQYATEAGLAARQAVYATFEGVDALETAFAAVEEARPRRVLEVGGGKGELGERLVRELGVELLEIDQSERMVELMRGRGLDALVADVQALPCADGEFDCAVAAWMLYHVPELDRALAELARVLRPGGRLVAVTNGAEHMRGLWQLIGAEPPEGAHVFRRENGAELLARHFEHVELRDAAGTVEFDREAAASYLTSGLFEGLTVTLPEDGWPRRVRTQSAVFVAEAPSD